MAATEAVVFRMLGAKELRPLRTEALTEEAFDMKLRTEYLEDFEALEPTDFVSQSSKGMALSQPPHRRRKQGLSPSF